MVSVGKKKWKGLRGEVEKSNRDPGLEIRLLYNSLSSVLRWGGSRKQAVGIDPAATQVPKENEKWRVSPFALLSKKKDQKGTGGSTCRPVRGVPLATFVKRYGSRGKWGGRQNKKRWTLKKKKARKVNSQKTRSRKRYGEEKR